MNDPLRHREELTSAHKEFTASDGLDEAVSGSSQRRSGRV